MYQITNIPAITHLNNKSLAHFLSTYTRPISLFASVLRKYRFVRVFVIVTFLCYNTRTLESFELKANLGRIDTSSVYDFQTYFQSNLVRQFSDLLERDYIDVLAMTQIDLHVLKYNPISGGTWCELPKEVKTSKSIINVKNGKRKNACFLYAIAAALFPVPKSNHNPDRASNYEDSIKQFRVKDTDLPMPVHRIPFFERANNITVNVYTYDKKTKLPLYKSNTNYEAQVNLFLYNGHYSTISSFQRFIGGDHQFVCPRCLVGYRNKQCFDSHTERCVTLTKTVVL